jgi:hypothetical protein
MPAADRSTRPTAALRVLQVSLLFAIAGFAWLRFSDNTVDNDLWGHVLYGQRYWNQGHVRGPEMFSWTASGFEVVNHEYLAEIVMGWIHRVGGGTGLWLYMIAMGLATVTLALGFGRGTTPAQRWAVLLLFAASINFTALGFAVRPQLFTTLFLVVELGLLRELSRGRFAAALLLPPLFALWGNFHGGVLAGVIIFILFVAAETVESLWPRALPSSWTKTRPTSNTLRKSWVVAIVGVGAMLLNPWGVRLVAWNIGATLRPRPQIHEWHWTTPSAANAPFYIVVAISVLAWCFSRQPKKLWEAATLLLLAAMGVMHQRHTPLFALANLMFSPPHLADVAERIAPHARDLVAAFRRPFIQGFITVALLVAGGASFAASFSAPKEKPWTMEVEKNVFPVAATEFIQAHRLFGKTITFFDWGQQNIWELPQNPVSFDGRFDTGYPADVIAAHWDFYRGKAMNPAVKWSEAEVALLPTGSGGVKLLVDAGWRILYRDPLASVLVSPHGRYAESALGPPLLRRENEALRGRVRFPDAVPQLATAAAP